MRGCAMLLVCFDLTVNWDQVEEHHGRKSDQVKCRYANILTQFEFHFARNQKQWFYLTNKLLREKNSQTAAERDVDEYTFCLTQKLNKSLPLLSIVIMLISSDLESRHQVLTKLASYKLLCKCMAWYFWGCLLYWFAVWINNSLRLK